MKRAIVMLTVLLSCMMATAQVKVSPQMTVGMKKVYELTATNHVGGMDINGVSTMEYEVVEATADGYILAQTTTKVDVADMENAMMAKIMNLLQEAMLNHPIKIATDKEGKPIRVINMDEVKQASMSAAEKMLDDLYAENPQLSAAVKKESVMEQLESQLTEEESLKAFTSTQNPLMLNGKEISDGLQESYKDAQDMKMLRTYHVSADGKSVTYDAVSNMSAEDVKAHIISTVKKLMPDQAEMVEQNIDMLIGSGMAKIDSKEHAEYKLGDDGWVESIDMTSSMDMMGQKMKQAQKMRLK